MSLTSKSVSELGRRLRVDLLISQAYATLKLVAGDPLVSKALGASFIAKMTEKVERLEASFKNRMAAEERSREGTLLQRQAAKEADAWRRDFTETVKDAIRSGADVPADGGRMGKFTTPITLAVEVERLVEYAQTFSTQIAAVDVVITPEMLKRGSDLASALRQADVMQEHLRFAERGAAIQGLHREAVAVFNAVRYVNGKARAVYKRDLKKAKPFNLRMLMRKGTGTAGPPTESPPLTPSVESPSTGKEAASA